MTDPELGTPHPDDVDAELKKLMAVRTGTAYDVIWSHHFGLDPEKREATHAKMIMQMARYARQDIGTVEEMEFVEVDRYYRTLVDIVSHENSMSVED